MSNPKEQITVTKASTKENMENNEEEEEDVPITKNPFYKHLKNIDMPVKHDKGVVNEDAAALRRVTFCGAFQDTSLHVPVKASTRKSILKTVTDHR